jgi:hypothetical protein
LVAAGVLALALIGGSTAGVMNYFNSRFPNDAEEALLAYVPLALTLNNSCTRNAEAEQDIANVQASVTCTSDGDAANTVVFTKFTSPEALDSHYQSAVAAAGIGQSSDKCLSAERAENAYTSESGRMGGQVLCYQQRGSSFIKWTDEQSQTSGVATRTGPDYVKLRDWWAGVVGLPTMAESEAQAQARKQVEEAQKQAEEAKKQQEEEAERQAEEAQRQVAAAQKQAEEARQQAQNDRRQDQNEGRSQSQDDASQNQNDDQSQNQNDDQSQNQNDTRQVIQQLVNDAIERAIQQQGNASDRDIKQQVEDDIRRSIQQRLGNAGGQGIEQLVDDAIERAIEQSEQNQR